MKRRGYVLGVHDSGSFVPGGFFPDLYSDPGALTKPEKVMGRVAECEFSVQCAFYRKYNRRTSPAWRGFIRQYCFQGNHEAVCRRVDAEQSNRPLEADVMPSGQRVPLFFHDLP